MNSSNQNYQQILHGQNQTYVEDLYEQYQKDPSSVDSSWIPLFQSLKDEGETLTTHRSSLQTKHPPAEAFSRQSDSTNGAPGDQKDLSTKVMLLMHAYRHQGYLSANLDPLGMSRTTHYNLEPASHGIAESDLEKEVEVFYGGRSVRLSVKKVIQTMEETYCGSLGVEFRYLTSEARRFWFLSRMEKDSRPGPSAERKLELYRLVYKARHFEEFLQQRFIGKKRFSLEGAESLIGALHEAIEIAGQTGLDHVVIGMAHRGRLNVLANIMQKDPSRIFAEFKESIPSFFVNGDVKYHLGYSADVNTASGKRVHLSLAFNPSHLEIVNPVVLGSVRARQTALGHLQENRDLPILIHGDAAFSGQGINYELLNMSALDGYHTGGALHIIVNNQIGFTTLPEEGRSTDFVTDLARMLQVPVLHVNANDPIAVTRAIGIAMEWRNTFHTDVFVDLIGYRKMGHNETDEPSFTQPVMVQAIEQCDDPATAFRKALEKEGLSPGSLDEIEKEAQRKLKEAYDLLDQKPVRIKIDPMGGVWQKYKRYDPESNPDTGFGSDALKEIAKAIYSVPESFQIHPKLEKLLEQRKNAILEQDAPLDWGNGENLAYGSLLYEGIPLRLSGQDSKRGTFSHRQATLFDQKTGAPYTPLEHLHEHVPGARGAGVEIINSPLSEAGVLGFEYGFSMSDPDRLVIWEAQFGDFANSAQVIIDQFISSSEAKWGKMNGLVTFLPHGYEGMGPEHSSARMERFLQLCALNNMQIAVPTNPAQMFHLLRRQMLRNFRKPLVVFTPKSLLRHPLAVSNLEDLTQGTYQRVIDETDPSIKPEQLKRLILCTGKVYYDLFQAREEKGVTDVGIVRLEQLYPYPSREMRDLLIKYQSVPEIAWVQEEPMNQGAWSFMRNRLFSSIGSDQKIVYSGRVSSSSPATGFATVHKKEQKRIMDTALDSSFQAPDMKFFCELWT